MQFQHWIKYICVCGIFISIIALTSCSSSKTVKGENGYKTSISNNTNNKNDDKISNKDNKSSKKIKNKEVIKEAKKWLGTKYKYGGHSQKGTDCSGLVMEIYLSVFNIKLPRSSKEQHSFCIEIKKSQLDVGDLVFFATGKSKKTVSHVGLYIGNNEFIHSSSSKGVIISNLEQSYYKRTYHSSGRVKK